MRRACIMVALGAIAIPTYALALQAGDAMAAWHGASSSQKAKLVAELLHRDGAGGNAASIITCLDAASSVDGHADLPIAEVAKACRANIGDPV